MVENTEYLSKIIPHSQIIIFDDCGHFMSHDKCEEAAKSIVEFADKHSFSKVNGSKDRSIKFQKFSLSVIHTIVILCFFLAFIIIIGNNFFYIFS